MRAWDIISNKVILMVKIYLSGGMSGLSWDAQMAWRNDIKDYCKENGRKASEIYSPPRFYTVDGNESKTEREEFEYHLNRLRHSDVVVVNFNSPKSIGTAMEVMLAKELRIPVIGILENKNIELHPWLTECVTRMCDSVDEANEHICKYYLGD